jgi:hypothetical protein
MLEPAARALEAVAKVTTADAALSTAHCNMTRFMVDLLPAG